MTEQQTGTPTPATVTEAKPLTEAEKKALEQQAQQQAAADRVAGARKAGNLGSAHTS